MKNNHLTDLFIKLKWFSIVNKIGDKIMAREIDDVYKRIKYKKEQYGDKKSRRDDYTGERVFMGNDRDAQYKHPTSKISDTDHITPIGVVEERYKRLTKEQQRALVNNEKHNYATTNSKLNRSKGDLENHEYLIRQGKKGEPEKLKTSVTMLAKEFDSRVHMDAEATGMHVKNVLNTIEPNASELVKKSTDVVKSSGGSFVTGATDTLIKSAIPLTAEAVRKMVRVSQGKESLGDAARDMGKISVDIAVFGGTKEILANSKSTVLKSITNSNELTQIIVVASIVRESAVKYINGEIDEKEFIEEAGEKGAAMVAGMIGGDVGRKIGGIIGAGVGNAALPGAGLAAGYITGEVIGEVLGIIITTVACGTIVSTYSTLKHMNDYKLKENQLSRLESEAILEMSNQREKLKSIMDREYIFWDEKIQSGFDMLLRGACEQTFNLQGVTDGLDKILGVFGKSVAFKDLGEYEGQLGDTLILNFGRG